MSLVVSLALTLSSGALEAPITAVTVYSDRARVTRTASLELAGTQKVELPLLLESADRGSIRVEATGAEVERVDIAPVEDDELPADEARNLLDLLERLDDQLSLLQQEQQVYLQSASALDRLAPSAPAGDGLRAPPKLNGAGWSAVVAFSSDQLAKLQAKQRELSERLVDLAQQRGVLAEKAALLGGAKRRTGFRVSPTLSGKGRAKLTLTYATAHARWHPSYDLQLLPDTGKVQVSFAGLVSQETGEDWNQATLTLSTAIPATSTQLPKLFTWKIGERDRFIPTPVPLAEWVRPPPAAAPPPAPEAEARVLRARLAAQARSLESRFASAAAVGQQISGGRGAGFGRVPADEESKVEFDDQALEGEQAPPEPQAFAAAPSPPQAVKRDRSVSSRSAAPAAREDEASMGSAEIRDSARPSTLDLSLAAPGGYRPPSYAADLPASLAGGYDLAYPSLRPETVQSGKGARRVALFSESWPVSVERKLFPALAPEAFLVAEIKSPSKQVLPGGNANLFVGADPAGTAKLNLVSPGEAFTLPLGLDRAIRPVRNTKLVLAEKGLISKDELSEYLVTIEVANPYAVPMPIRIIDQWPVTSDKEVEVKLLKTEPYAIQDKVVGSLEWRLNVPARSKTVASFTYSIRRPKGWRMHQQ